MSDERQRLLFLTQILDSTNRHKDMIDLMKKVIDINPDLSTDERNLLSVTYKNLIDVNRNNLRTIDSVLENDISKHPKCIEPIQKIHDELVLELETRCLDLIKLVDEKLLPACTNDNAKVFYIKLKADYYRYICEAKTTEQKDKYAELANQGYLDAIELAKKFIPNYNGVSLGIYLNYSVFLYETVSKKEEALELAKKTFAETEPLIEQNSEASYQEAKMILTLINENINLWTTVLQ